MTGRLDCPGFVDSDMCRFGCNDRFIRLQNSTENQQVGLRASGGKMDYGLILSDGFTDQFAGFPAVHVQPIAFLLNRVGAKQSFKDSGMGPFAVVIFKTMGYLVMVDCVHSVHLSCTLNVGFKTIWYNALIRRFRNNKMLFSTYISPAR